MPPLRASCPICDQNLQKYPLGWHIAKHTKEELLPFISNKAELTTASAHPEIACEDFFFVLCPSIGEGYIKGGPAFKKHQCVHCYTSWNDEQKQDEPNEQTEEEVELVVEEAAEENCECHVEISRLKQQIKTLMSELTELRTWRNNVVNTAPEPKAENIVAEPPKEKKKRVVEIKASKKEKEKGMWCTQCESCKTIAQFTADLRPCGACKKMCHFNDDLHSCYHWDCSICKTAVCLQCCRNAGGNKLHPLCSAVCAKKYKETRT
jgi:hypothetical protein